jgi:hypothetical protein
MRLMLTGATRLVSSSYFLPGHDVRALQADGLVLRARFQAGDEVAEALGAADPGRVRRAVGIGSVRAAGTECRDARPFRPVSLPLVSAR